MAPTQTRGGAQAGGRAEQILNVAERLVQTRGFNAFSYADVAAELHITKPALHYHFPGKAALGLALVTRYAERFRAELESIDHSHEGALAKLDAFVALYAAVMVEDRMCLCGMLAAEYQTLPDPMKEAVITFFDETEAWLVRILNEGEDQGAIRPTDSLSAVAQVLIGGLEGAMLVARSYGDIARFQHSAATVLELLKP
ncbi:TetR/AcrR family transcriptional regulator [Specibacter cremeus]|uniref:TetR/AcrR family transcriptional regulator n=1 Tax=Specibacter cremeus TaxID=1629051 RepID=UPI000F7A0616|nr:TetR/AcrR family transcriptional regulator [Specibacter cremeus]